MRQADHDASKATQVGAREKWYLHCILHLLRFMGCGTPLQAWQVVISCP